MELRFMHSNADVKEGDLLTTSGIDGVYPQVCLWRAYAVLSGVEILFLRALIARQWPRCMVCAMCCCSSRASATAARLSPFTTCCCA